MYAMNISSLPEYYLNNTLNFEAKLDPPELESQRNFEYPTRKILENRVLGRVYPGFELKVSTLVHTKFGYTRSQKNGTRYSLK